MGGVISYRRIVCDLHGNLRAYQGEIPVEPNEQLSVGPLNYIGESFSYEYTAVDTSGTWRVTEGDVTTTVEGGVRLGTMKLGGSIDARNLTAQATAEFKSCYAWGRGSVDVPGASVTTDGQVEGPFARGLVGIGLDGGGAKVGVSAGQIGGQVGVTVGGQSYGFGGEIGLKAELGLSWSPTTKIALPLITISGPNPIAGVTAFAARAISELIQDPARVTEQLISDMVNVGADAVEAADQVVEGVSEVLRWVFEDEPEDNVFTVDQFQGRRPPYLPPGVVLFD
ncbi:hypothetical protein [Streptomyces sp. MN13]